MYDWSSSFRTTRVTVLDPVDTTEMKAATSVSTWRYTTHVTRIEFLRYASRSCGASDSCAAVGAGGVRHGRMPVHTRRVDVVLLTRQLHHPMVTQGAGFASREAGSSKFIKTPLRCRSGDAMHGRIRYLARRAVASPVQRTPPGTPRRRHVVSRCPLRHTDRGSRGRHGIGHDSCCTARCRP